MKMKYLLLILAIFTYGFVIAQSVNTDEVKFKNKPIIKMELNGKKTWVLLDTGSSISILDDNAAEEFGFYAFLMNESEFQVPGLGSENNQLLHARKVDLRFGKTRLRNQFFAFDLSNVTESIASRTGKKVTAIIGTNMMSKYGFVIDLGNNTVTMRNAKKKEQYIASH